MRDAHAYAEHEAPGSMNSSLTEAPRHGGSESRQPLIVRVIPSRMSASPKFKIRFSFIAVPLCLRENYWFHRTVLLTESNWAKVQQSGRSGVHNVTINPASPEINTKSPSEVIPQSGGALSPKAPFPGPAQH